MIKQTFSVRGPFRRSHYRGTCIAVSGSGRFYEYTAAILKNKVWQITAGCRRWSSFKEAYAHYRKADFMSSRNRVYYPKDDKRRRSSIQILKRLEHEVGKLIKKSKTKRKVKKTKKRKKRRSSR